MLWELLGDTRSVAERPATPSDERVDEGAPAAGVAPTTPPEKAA
ncbi:MAG TPA: hypothetical protein VIS03_03445 [Kiloniellaceae bacterium]